MAVRRATNNLIVFIGAFVLLILQLWVGTRRRASQPVSLRLIGASLVLVLVVAIVQFGMRIFFPERMLEWTEHFSYRRRQLIFFAHKIAVVAVFAFWGSSLFVHGHQRQNEMTWFAIESVIVVICLADLMNATANVWRLQKPIPPTTA